MRNFLELLRYELSIVFKDKAVILIIYIATVLYAFLYGALYGPQIVENMPVAVVDMDGTALSHEFAESFDATAEVEVVYRPESLVAAKQMLLDRQISGIFYIPDGFEKDAFSGKASHVGIYADGSYFLLYAAMSKAASGATLTFGRKLQIQRFVAQGQDFKLAQTLACPAEFSVETLYNHYSGYATAIMPAVFAIILQQTLLMIIGMIIGSQCEFKLWRRLNIYSTLQVLLAKVFAYFTAALPSAFFLFYIAYKIFGYPMLDNPLAFVTFMIPYILAIVCLGIALGGLFHRREASVFYLAPFSILFVLWSGVSWPKESMPEWFYNLGVILPSSSGIRGITSLRTCGNSLQDVSAHYLTLWTLTVIYFIAAYFSLRQNRRFSLK